MSEPRKLRIAFIPDGNGRWGKRRNLLRQEAHGIGLNRFNTLARVAFDTERVTEVIVWALSTLNRQRRKQAEVARLEALLKKRLRHQLERPEEVQFRLRGLWRDYIQDRDIIPLAEEVEEKSARFVEKTITVLLDYGGRQDLEWAAQALVREQALAERFHELLLTADIGDVDMIFRTGCEQDPKLEELGMFAARSSDCFLPWQQFNSVLIFSKKYWPDFTVDHLTVALQYYESDRCRKMNGT